MTNLVTNLCILFWLIGCFRSILIKVARKCSSCLHIQISGRKYTSLAWFFAVVLKCLSVRIKNYQGFFNCLFTFAFDVCVCVCVCVCWLMLLSYLSQFLHGLCAIFGCECFRTKWNIKFKIKCYSDLDWEKKLFQGITEVDLDVQWNCLKCEKGRNINLFVKNVKC